MERVYERPFQATSIEVDTLRAFPLVDMTEQLKGESAFRDSGRGALTLVHSPNLTLVLTVVRAGAACDAHHPPGPAAIMVLSGTLVLSVPHGDTPTTLQEGSMVAVGRNITHVLVAKSDSAFLTIIGPQKHSSRKQVRRKSATARPSAIPRKVNP